MEGISGLGFWIFLAIIIGMSSWEKIRKQQIKSDLILRMMETGQDIDQKLLDSLLPSEKKNMDDGAGGAGFIFILIGVGLAIAGVAVGFNPNLDISYPFIGIGIFCFLFGNYIWVSADKKKKADEAMNNSSIDN